MPLASNAAVLRFESGGRGSGNVVTSPSSDADDRVQAAVGDPCCSVGPDDHAMWRAALPQRDLGRLAGLRIEDAQPASQLCRVPDRSIRRGCDVVRVRARRNVELLVRVGGRRRRRHRWSGSRLLGPFRNRARCWLDGGSWLGGGRRARSGCWCSGIRRTSAREVGVVVAEGELKPGVWVGCDGLAQETRSRAATTTASVRIGRR